MPLIPFCTLKITFNKYHYQHFLDSALSTRNIFITHFCVNNHVGCLFLEYSTLFSAKFWFDNDNSLRLSEAYMRHWNLTIIGSDNGLSPDRHQAIIWTNGGILLIGPLVTNFNELLIKIQYFSFDKMRFKMSSGKFRQFCLGPNVTSASDFTCHKPSRFGMYPCLYVNCAWALFSCV